MAMPDRVRLPLSTGLMILRDRLAKTCQWLLCLMVALLAGCAWTFAYRHADWEV